MPIWYFFCIRASLFTLSGNLVFFWSLEFKIWPLFDYTRNVISAYLIWWHSSAQENFTLPFPCLLLLQYVFFTSGILTSQIMISWIYFLGLKLFSYKIQLFLLCSLKEISICQYHYLPFQKIYVKYFRHTKEYKISFNKHLCIYPSVQEKLLPT